MVGVTATVAERIAKGDIRAVDVSKRQARSLPNLRGSGRPVFVTELKHAVANGSQSGIICESAASSARDAWSNQ